ncbi:hypothetical protein AWH48_18295 [Domibacillus aminovorans]|uniref:Uncharacterized protein n=1 Tax=Domibacillus aminovorans TaxID=29332 RepID=A0A177KYS3_9BACI|nr:hypothetical protein AWH48_18295 [Domibacillus aminovorans]
MADKMPENLHRAMAPFFNAAELYDMYGVLLRAKASVDRSICVEDDEDAYIKAFKSAIYSYISSVKSAVLKVCCMSYGRPSHMALSSVRVAY